MDKKHFKRIVFKVLKKSKLIFNGMEWAIGFKDIRVQKQIHIQNPIKSAKLIRKEKKLVRQYWHCGTFHYYRYGLPYFSLSDEELLDYVPTYYHHKKLEKDHAGIDTVKHGDKLTQAKLFRDRGIPTAEVVAFNKGKQWFSFEGGKEIDIIATIEKLFLNGNGKLFFKPTGGQGGLGIFVLKKIDNGFVVNGEKTDLSVFLQTLCKKTYILQKGLVQSQQMMDINPSSLNTLRIVVQQEGNRMKMKTCIIRMGREGREIDNSAQGGISARVDIETGKVAKTATAEHGGGIMTCHPDTNKAFGNITINHWESLQKEIEAIGTKLIDYKNIALDIAITEEGAKLLEFNFRYGIEHQQCVLGGVRQLLGVYPK